MFSSSPTTATSGALTNEHNDVTGTTPPPVPCPDSLCEGKSDGNYAYYYYNYYRANYFVQCSGGIAQCQACFPSNLEFSEDCNQCLYSKHGMICLTLKAFLILSVIFILINFMQNITRIIEIKS